MKKKTNIKFFKIGKNYFKLDLLNSVFSGAWLLVLVLLVKQYLFGESILLLVVTVNYLLAITGIWLFYNRFENFGIAFVSISIILSIVFQIMYDINYVRRISFWLSIGVLFYFIYFKVKKKLRKNK